MFETFNRTEGVSADECGSSFAESLRKRFRGNQAFHLVEYDTQKNITHLYVPFSRTNNPAIPGLRMRAAVLMPQGFELQVKSLFSVTDTSRP